LGIVTFSTDAGDTPMDIFCAVLTLESVPMAAATLPAGIGCLVLTAENLPKALKIKKSHFFALFLKDFRSCSVFLCEGVKTFLNPQTTKT
jgi:hypothetical protein